MSIPAAATLMGRTQAESLMVTPCVIARATGAVTTDSDTFVETPTMETIFTGVCKLRFPSASEASITGQVSGLVLSKDRATLSIPVGATGSASVTTDDVVTLGASPLDSGTAGVVFRVVSVHHQTYATARRFAVEQVS